MQGDVVERGTDAVRAAGPLEFKQIRPLERGHDVVLANHNLAGFLDPGDQRAVPENVEARGGNRIARGMDEGQFELRSGS